MKGKRWIQLAIGIVSMVVLLALGLALFLYVKFEPNFHFQYTSIPVLAVPNVDLDGKRLEEQDERMRPLASNLTREHETTDLEAMAKAAQTQFNILLLGIDARDQEDSRTDVIMLVNVNISDHTIHLISIPRDTRVKLPGIGYTKINHAHILGELGRGNRSGTEASLQAVSNLCQCEINYVVKTDFEGFEHFIDKLGGLDIELQQLVHLSYSNKSLQPGVHHLDGKTALEFVRERHSLPGGDHSRQEHQALIVKAIIQKLLEPSRLLELPLLYEQVKEEVVDTNLNDADIASLAWLAYRLKGDHIAHIRLPGQEGVAFDPLLQRDLYYWIPDDAEWKEIVGNVFKL